MKKFEGWRTEELQYVASLIAGREIWNGKAFDDLYKKEKGRKRVTQKGIGNYILELFQKGLDKEDGYEIKPLKDT